MPELPADLHKNGFVLITGGGTGLGLAAAKRFAACGARVAITGRREAVLEGAVKQIIAAAGGRADAAVAVGMDVRDPHSVRDGVDAVVKHWGGQLPTVVINNAAGNFISPTEKLSPNAWKAIVDIVLMGTVHVTTDIGRRWIERRQIGVQKAPDMLPQVVFMSIGASYVVKGQPFLAPSAAAKTAVLNVMNSLAVEWGKYNIRCFMVSPGPIYTEGAFSRLDPTGQNAATGDVQDHVPLGRMGTTDEYANLVAFLCSPMCSWLSGTNVHLDGGATVGGGEFGQLKKVTHEEWGLMEAAIRKQNAKDKAQRAKAKL